MTLSTFFWVRSARPPQAAGMMLIAAKCRDNKAIGWHLALCGISGMPIFALGPVTLCFSRATWFHFGKILGQRIHICLVLGPWR